MSIHLKKTTSFAIVHFTVAFTVTYVLTGNWLVASAVALIEPCINTVAFFFHELAWSRRLANQNDSVFLSAPPIAPQPGAEK